MMADGREFDKAVVSPQHSGDAEAIANRKNDSFIVSPMSIDDQLQRQIDLNYPEVYLRPREEHIPEVATFRDGSDAPEVVPLNDPGYHANEKYTAPEWYRGQRPATPTKQQDEQKRRDYPQPMTSSLPNLEQNKSGFDAESDARKQDHDNAKEVSNKRRRSLWIWLGIAAIVIIVIALAVGLGVALGTRNSGNTTPAHNTSDATSSSVPSSTTSFSSSSLSSTQTISTPSSTVSSAALRCPRSNSTTYTISGKSFSTQCGIDYSGGNIDTLNATDLTYCINSCATTDECIGATFLGAACYLKSTLSSPVYSNSEVAGGRLITNKYQPS